MEVGRSVRQIAVIFACMYATLGCTDTLNVVSSGSQQASVVPASASFATIDDYFADLNRSIPGFGGWFFDEAGNPTVYLVDMTHKEHAEDLIRPEAQARRIYLKAGITPTPMFKFVQATYEFNQLKQWQLQLAPLMTNRTATSLDVDEKTNKVGVGVRSLLLSDQVQSQLGFLGVPAAAVVVRLDEDSPTLMGDNDSLISRVRPTPGGVGLAMSSGGGCTLGVNVQINWIDAAILTNSHCTPTFGVDGTNALQGFAADSIIATEFLDHDAMDRNQLSLSGARHLPLV